MQMKPDEIAVYLTGPQTARRYGVTPMTLWRWRAHPRLAFPSPVKIGRLNFWRLEELEEWERSRPRAQVGTPAPEAA